MAQQFDIVGNLLLKVDGAEAGLSKLKSSLSQLKIPANLDNDLKKSFSNLDGLFAKYKSQLKDGFNTKGDVSGFAKTGKLIEAEYDKISATISKLTGKEVSLKIDLTAIQNAEKEVERLVSLKEKLSKDIKGGLGLNDYLKAMQASNVGRRGTKVFDASNMLQTSLGRGDIEKAKADVESLISELNRMSDARKKALEQHTGVAFSQIIQDLKSKVESADQSMNKLSSDIKTTSDNMAKMSADQFDRAGKVLGSVANDAGKAQSGIKQLNGEAQAAANSILSMSTQLQQLQQSTQYFFSLRNMVNLLKRGIDEAVQSVKDLDKAMTETAVVTDYKVSDLWGMLPEYTKVANELGATTQGAYETMTLYYQQGLEQQQAFELGAETMKMARIAGLDYAETTDMMTAALRGFNMELNETSAKRVNDVYSELAAITASDTEELGTAMQRTASIAASAGASFEGTTAFLAQAIETTREPAENIGTAMKTIVARFQELKKNPLEISEVEGEEVDYNKIDAALKTIGVDLKDTNGQFRNFDDVMLDISARWDSLSQAQQRYIATTAAGSRQQSRFIAMVSNYDRTMQLMEAANNSAGASDEQFEKTMDSLESKLNQLHNAWQAFTMGIANNSMIKLAVDGLTNFLTVTNNIIDKLSMGSGAIKSFLSVFAAFTGLKAAGRIANRAIGGLGGLIDPQSTFKEGFRGGAIKQGQSQAKAISTPIVNSLSKISGQIAAIAKARGIDDSGQKGQGAVGTKETSKEDYKQIKQAFDKLSGKNGFRMEDASNLFKQLDDKHQYSMFKNSPGTKAAMKQASLNWIDSNGWSEEFTKEGKKYVDSIYKGMEQGKIPVSKGISLIGQPAAWGKVFGTDVAKNISSSYIKTLETNTQQAHQDALKYLVPFGHDVSEYSVGSDAFKQLYKSFNDSQKEAYLKAFKEGKEKLPTLGESKGTVSDMGRFANDIGAVADRFTQAGYSISAFGGMLSQLGGPIGAIGTGLQTLGGIVSGLGSGIIAATSLIELFTVGVKGAGDAIIMTGAEVAAFAAPIAALVAGFLLIRHHIKQVKEAGEEVTNTFKETNKTAEDNIAKLKSYRSELAILSKGVDSNGNNVNLDDSQYQRYLEIVDDIAAINPEIVEGYNAQGHAIINNNEALAETLKLQEQNKQAAIDAYTDPEKGLQKLIDARNINSAYGNSIINPTSSKAEDAGLRNVKRAPFATDVKNIVDNLSLTKGFKDFDLTKYGIESLDALLEGEEKSVKNFVKHRQQIEADLSNSGINLSDAVLKGFDKLGENATAFDEAIKPVYDNLLARVSNSTIFESIAPDFKNALNMGLKDLAASQELSGSEMAQAANNMALKFANLTTGSGKYQDALSIVEKAQQKFADTLNETEYKADVQPAIDSLRRLKEEALDEGSAYGDALAEYLENQIQQIARFTEEGSTTIQEGLNTAVDAIAEAESALEGFNEATKKDFSTAAEDMRSIYDKIFETYKDSYGNELTKHTEGKGDNTFWTGAEALLSQNKLSGGVDEVTKSLKKLEPWLREGKEGMDAFFTDVINNNQLKELQDKGLIKLDERGWFEEIPEGQWEAVANALGISENLLTSMLNKARQFGLISFDNLDKVREALATGDSAITGATSNAKGQKALYVKEDTMRQNLREAGYNTKESQDKVIANLLKEQNVHMVKTMDNLSATTAKNLVDAWGVKDLPDLITKMSETGDYTRDEILDLAEKAGLGSGEAASKAYDDIIQALDNPELAKQTSVLETISNQIAALTAGSLDEQEQAQKDFSDMVNGGEGTDTAYEQFASGMDANGQSLDAGEYAETRSNLEDAIALAKKQAAEQKQWAEESFGAEHDKHVALAKKYEEDAKNLQDWLDSGEKAWEDAENRRARREQANKEKEEQEEAKRKALDYYYKNGFQNAGSVNRPEIKWGKDPTKNSNFRAATTWFEGQSDKEVANALKGSTSTYLSQADTFTDLNGKTFSLAFTPVLAGPNGQDGQVLSSDTVYNYLDQAITKATDKKGNIDLDKLLQIDKEGLEVEGQQINNLLMGAFTGEGQEAASGALGELEHQLEEIKTKTKENEIETQKWNNLTEQTKKNIAKQNAKQDQSKGQKRTETVTKKTEEINEKTETVTYDAKETDEAEKLKKEYDDHNSRNTQRIVEYLTKGEDELQVAEDKITAIDGKIADPKELILKSKYSEVTKASEWVNKVLDLVSKDAKLNVNANYSQVTNAKSALNTIAGKAFSASLSVSTGGALTALEKIWNLIVKIKNNNPGGSSKGTPNAGHRTSGPQEKATGARNHGIASIPVVGSAARGGYGRLGPKGKGGPTLTGELGYEIAWLPSENRSMILGANGPQMINLPGDAVVWTHEQSKKILKQKAIPAGSHVGPSATGDSSDFEVTYNSNSGSKKEVKKVRKKKPKTSTDKATEKAEKTSKKLYTWWDKMERKVKNAETYSNRLDKKLNKMLSDIRMTMDTMQKANKKYVDTLKSLRDNYKKMEKSAKKTLSAVSKGNKKVKVAGKKVNIGSIIDYDASTQSYTIDRKAINKKYGKKKKGKEAIDDIVAWLDKWQGRLDTGRDKSQEYQDKLDEYQKEVRNAFLGWENELTKVYKITNEIALLEAKIANDEKRASLAQAKIDDFNWILGDKSALKQNLSDLFNAINAQIAKQTANQSNIQSLRTATEEEFAAMNKDISASRLKKINKRGWGNLSDDEKRDWVQHQALTKYLQNGQVDYKKFEQDKKDRQITGEQYNLLKQWFDDYQDKQIAIEDAEGKELENEQALYDLEQQRIQAGRDIAEQLYGWKNELTKIWNITQQIANTEGMLGRVKSQNALLESEMSAGLSQFSDAFSDRSMKFFKGELDLSFKSIEQTWKSSQLQREEINNLWDATREKKELAIATKQYEDAKAARDEAVLAQAQAQEAADTVDNATAALGDAQNDLSDANAALQAARDEKAKDQKALKAAQKKLKKATSKSSKTKLKNKIANLKVEIKEDKKDIAAEKTNIKNANAIIDSQQALIDSNQELAGQLDAYTEAAGDASSQYYIAQGRLEAAQEEMKIRDLAHEFLSARQQADGTLSLDFDSAAFEARRGVDIDKEQAERITEYVKELTDTVDQLHATYKDITDKLKELYDLLADLKEKMATDSETLLNAYEDHRKSEVSQLRSQFERINSTLKDILDKVKKEIDRRRQREDNEKTEKNISKMQQRLNAMRSNTASGNQTEIMQLQQDIADAQQNYTRSLEDQLISRLQSNADEAYRQRQQQIALLNGLLEVEHATGVSARYIEDLINSENWEVIKALWLEKENYDAATVWRKDVLEAQLNTFLTELSLLPRKIWEAQETIKQAQEFGKLVEELNANGLVSEGTYRGYSAGGGGGEPEKTLTLQELHDEGATPLDVYNYVAPDGSMPYRDWYTVFSAEDANISDPEHNRLWDVQEAKEAGQSALNLQKIYEEAGIVQEVATRLAAGAEGLTSYDKEIISTYNMVDSLLADYSGKEIQITTDAEGRAVISAIGEGLASVENISLGNITKADAAGLQTYLEMKNKEIQGTVNEKGTYIGGNKGSSMVFQSITYNDDGTVEYGEAYTKKWAELTKKNALNNPKEVADAIVYRLTHGSVNEESDLQKQFEKLGNAVGSTYLEAGKYKNEDGSYTKVSYDSKGQVSFDYVGTKEDRDAFKEYKGNLSSKGTISAKQLEKALDKGDAAGKTTGETLKALINTKGLTAKEVGDAAKKAGMTKKEYQNALIEAGYSKEKAKELTKKSFLKGGIADFTGPAWLDGTPSKPELVLNAKDTKNFIALKDVLSRVMKLHNSGDDSFSNANFEINVNVDHISSDYDVDKLTERIKRNIVKDAGYRNVTQARRMR